MTETEYDAYCLVGSKGTTPNKITIDSSTKTAWCSVCPLKRTGNCTVESVTVTAFLAYNGFSEIVYRNSK